jgi:hypothetical protein
MLNFFDILAAFIGYGLILDFDWSVLKKLTQHFHGSVSISHFAGQGKSSISIGHFPHCCVHMYLAALISAFSACCVLFFKHIFCLHQS